MHTLSVSKQEAKTTQCTVQLTLYSFMVGIYNTETSRVTKKKKKKSKCKLLLEQIMECIDGFGTKSGGIYTATRF